MPVDKGGLRYPITVEDAFSSNLNEFIARTRAARLEWKQFKTELGATVGTKGPREAARAVDEAARAERRLTQERSRGRRESSAKEAAERRYSRSVFASAVAREEARIAEQRQFGLDRKILTQQQARRRAERDLAAVTNRRRVIEERLNIAKQRSLQLTEQEAVKLGLATRVTIRLTEEQKRLQVARDRLAASQSRQSSEELLRLEAQRRAIERITAARLKQLTAEELSRRGFSTGGQGIPSPEVPAQRRGILAFFDDLKKRVDASNVSGNRLSFTFRRLFGILAAFAAARFAVQLFRDMVFQTVRLNAELETAELGIAALIASVADVRDAQGQATDAASKLAIATGEARRQTKLLRIDALDTTATFQELVNTFQNALAPGLRAGLDVDQVREFSRQMSIAATSIGLEQRQLAEEVRSLLSATIRPQNTRIATFLGISNEDIRRAQQAGTLFEFLTERFAVFDKTGERAARTFAGLVERVRDGFQIIAQTGGVQFFENIKSLLDEIFQSLISINEVTKTIEANPELVQIVATITEGLSAGVDEARRLAEALKVQDIQRIAEGFRGLAQFISSVLGGIVEGLVLGLRDVSGALQFIQNVFQILDRLDIFKPEDLRTIVAFVVRLLTVVTAIGLVFSGLGLLFKSTVVILTSFVGLLKIARTAIVGIRTAAIGLNTVMAGLGIASGPFLVTLLAAAAAIGSILFAARELNKVFVEGENTISSTYGALKLVEQQINLKNAQLDVGRFLGASPEAIRKLTLEIEELKAQRNQLDGEFNEMYDNLGSKADEFVGEFVSVFKEGFSSILDDVSFTSDEFNQELQGLILDTSQALLDLRAEFDDLNQAVRQGRGEASTSRNILGLEQDIASIIRDRGTTNVDFLERSLKLTEEIKQHNLDLEAARNRLADPETPLAEIPLLQALETALISKINELERVSKQLETTLQSATSSRVLSQLLSTNFEREQEQALLRISAARDRLIAQAERERDVRRIAVLETQAELQTLNAVEKQRAESLQKSLLAVQKEIDLARERIEIIRQQDQNDNVPENLARIEQERELILALEQRHSLLQEELTLNAQITDAERQRLLIQQAINEAADQSPITTGFLQAFVESFDQVADRFQTTLDIMRTAIQGFSQFVAQSIVDAFDPTADQTIQERLARFLQQMAAQIIATLVQLAITAAVLNAASGGLLGPLLQSLSVAQGFAEGGDVGEKDRRHRRHQRAKARARGFAEGGSPGDRAVHGVARPSRGLHPSDTVPAWLSPKEYVIRAREVGRAGKDALERINRGLFDPMALREATGLQGWRRRASVARRGGAGLAAGGEASQVRRAAASPAGVGSGGGASQAIMAPNEEAFERMIRGGPTALLRFLAANGIRPNA